MTCLSGLRSRQILQAHSQASKFRNSEFDVLCEAETTLIPVQTDIYRIDLAYVFRQLCLKDDDSAPAAG